MSHRSPWIAALAAAALLLGAAIANAADPGPPRLPRNFAVAGATSGSDSAVAVADPATAGIVTASGLQLQGLTQQIDLAAATQFDVKREQDVAVLTVGANDYLFFGSAPASVVGRIRAALNRLSVELGFRTFVVFNLIPIGESPITQIFPPGTSASLSAAAVQHNALLRQELQAFERERPGTVVVRVDAAAAFATLAPPAFSRPGPASCVGLTDFASPSPVPLPAGGCNGFVWMDGLHLTSAAAAVLARTAASALAMRSKQPTGSLYTFGDSFADTGSLRDTVLRANVSLGNPPTTSPNGPAYFQGRFSDGPNLIDRLEDALHVKTRSAFFPQPRRLRIDLVAVGRGAEGTSPPRVSGQAFVPRLLRAGASTVRSSLTLEFGATTCEYRRRESSPPAYELRSCNGGARSGALVRFSRIRAMASETGPFSIELLYREGP